MRQIIIFSLVLICGCSLAVAPLETTEVLSFPSKTPYVGKTISVGLIVDNRFPFWPRKESQPPQIKEKKGELSKNFEPLPATKEVRLPMGEVRSNLANALKKSKRFEEIINPPQRIIGETISEMLKNSLETSDYLIVGEVNSFYTKLIGLNSRANYTYPVDVFFLGLPNLVCFLISGGRFFILSGGMFAVHTAECMLSLSLTIYSVDTGQPITTIHLREVARCPVDAATALGDLQESGDDWVDLGRRLGEVALQNACIQAIEEVSSTIKKLEKNKK